MSLRAPSLLLALAVAGAGMESCAKYQAIMNPPHPPETPAAVVHVDAEVFEAVVNRLLTGSTEKAYPYKLAGMVVDPVPGAKDLGFTSVARGSKGVLAVGIASTIDAPTTETARRRRVRILDLLNIKAGAAASYPKCPGTHERAQPTNPPRDLSVDCPQEDQNFVSVGWPIEGEPGALRELLSTIPHAPDPIGEVWTVVVSESFVGSGGQNWFQHAWVFVRSPTTGKLDLVDTVLLAWAE